ncbi:MAG: DUF2066 domain-containing protein [Halopseudomonas yangmingensis]|uniref:DUF2066 domain-containing protein n=1 Tax=Halopseudomonas yangmingensis TaxID=1720063 RepID=A0A1I4NG44_9GAMM|nr:DUF2066 domain-containing protein [Halopseudomonas yangmingensis]SFM14356.1 hypothetical protein SAMN05216217_101288 [Halopseudomonas yangmingensis]
MPRLTFYPSLIRSLYLPVLFAFSLVLLWPVSVQAEVLRNLYQAELAADAAADRQQQLRTALLEVLGRLAGSKAVGERLLADENPEAMLRRSSTTDDGVQRVEFEPLLVNGILHRAGIPMLGRNRPAALVWAVQSGVLGDEWLPGDGDWLTLLQQAAARRGVALALPLGDLQDRALVDEQSIRKADQTVLREASQRYAADGVLVLGLSAPGQAAQLDWHFWLGGSTRNGRLRGDDPAALADQLMLALADEIIAQYAVSTDASSAEGHWLLQVEGLRSLDDYAGLMRTLSQLGSEQAPRLVYIRGDQVRVALEFPGSLSQLQRLLALDHRLRPLSVDEEPLTTSLDDSTDAEQDGQSAIEDASPQPDSAQGPLLRFQWR